MTGFSCSFGKPNIFLLSGLNTRIDVLLVGRHCRMVPSLLALARYSLSWLKSSPHTSSVCSARVAERVAWSAVIVVGVGKGVMVGVVVGVGGVVVAPAMDEPVLVGAVADVESCELSLTKEGEVAGGGLRRN